MPDRSPIVLLDNCAISACWAAGGWKALVSRFQLETVEEVASEAATGAANRTIIDPRDFRTQVVVHVVDAETRLSRQIEFEELAALDDGERDLWVHALDRVDTWILCGPDIASIRFGVERGFADRLISLEELFEKIGFKPKNGLPPHQTKRWLKDTVGRFVLEKALKKSA